MVLVITINHHHDKGLQYLLGHFCHSLFILWISSGATQVSELQLDGRHLHESSTGIIIVIVTIVIIIITSGVEESGFQIMSS